MCACAWRGRRRDDYRRKGVALLRAGQRAGAQDCFQKCVDVTPAMAAQLMAACRAAGVECIVAPYEADAQMAFLSRHNYVDVGVPWPRRGGGRGPLTTRRTGRHHRGLGPHHLRVQAVGGMGAPPLLGEETPCCS